MAKDRGILLIDNFDDGQVLDIKVNVERDVSGKIVRGLIVGNTLEQNKALMLIGHQGDFKYRPDLGVGLEDILQSEDYLEYRHRIREHFEKDGLTVSRLDLYPNKQIIIEAAYEQDS